jgi:hypothetical protein
MFKIFNIINKKRGMGFLMGSVITVVLAALCIFTSSLIFKSSATAAESTSQYTSAVAGDFSRCACLFDPPGCPMGSGSTLNFPGCLPDKLAKGSETKVTTNKMNFFQKLKFKSKFAKDPKGTYDVDCSEINTASEFAEVAYVYKAYAENNEDGYNGGTRYGTLCTGIFRNSNRARPDFKFYK